MAYPLPRWVTGRAFGTLRQAASEQRRVAGGPLLSFLRAERSCWPARAAGRCVQNLGEAEGFDSEKNIFGKGTGMAACGAAAAGGGGPWEGARGLDCHPAFLLLPPAGAATPARGCVGKRRAVQWFEALAEAAQAERCAYYRCLPTPRYAVQPSPRPPLVVGACSGATY
jgi:hypothetical protein